MTRRGCYNVPNLESIAARFIKHPQKTRHYCFQGVLTLTKLELRRVVPLIALLVSHPTANSLELSARVFCRPVSSAFASLLFLYLHHREMKVAYRGSIGIYMRGDVFFAHATLGDGEAAGLIINIAVALAPVIAPLLIPQGLSVRWHIFRERDDKYLQPKSTCDAGWVALGCCVATSNTTLLSRVVFLPHKCNGNKR